METLKFSTLIVEGFVDRCNIVVNTLKEFVGIEDCFLTCDWGKTPEVWFKINFSSEEAGFYTDGYFIIRKEEKVNPINNKIEFNFVLKDTKLFSEDVSYLLGILHSVKAVINMPVIQSNLLSIYNYILTTL